MTALSTAFQSPTTICRPAVNDTVASRLLSPCLHNSFYATRSPRRRRYTRHAHFSPNHTVTSSLAVAAISTLAVNPPPVSAPCTFADCPAHLETPHTQPLSNQRASCHPPLVVTVSPPAAGGQARQTARPVSVVVTGVSKQAIHDYAIPDAMDERLQLPASALAPSTPPSLPAYLASPRTSPSSHHGHWLQFQPLSHSVADADDARSEFMLAARLITAAMMGVMLGVERRATKLYLSVRSVTVLSVVAALTTVLVSTLSSFPTLTDPASVHQHSSHHASQWSTSIPFLHLFTTPAVAALSVATLTALMVYATARAVAPNKEKIASMSAAVASAVGMGVASGAACPLLTAAFYLIGVAVMRSSKPPSRIPRSTKTSSHPTPVSPSSSDLHQ